MNKNLERVIEIPKGVEVIIKGNEFSVKGNSSQKGDPSKSGELTKSFNLRKIKAEIKDGKVVLTVKGATRRESKMMGTTWAHLNNMIKGIGEDFVYNLEICNVHFPMNVKQKDDRVVIKSFLGETTERVAKILPNVNVDIEGSKITVSSNDIEVAGQTAANLEKATRLTGRDRRIFQDGIFITEKPGRKI